jgi:hypothetical protein
VLHKEHKDTIVQTFRNVGLALNPDGSEDAELKIQDLPNLQVGEWRLPKESGVEDTIIVETPPASGQGTTL